MNARGIVLFVLCLEAAAFSSVSGSCDRSLEEAAAVTQALVRIQTDRIAFLHRKWEALDKEIGAIGSDATKTALRSAFPGRVPLATLRSYYSHAQAEGREKAILFLRLRGETTSLEDPLQLEAQVAAVLDALGYLLYANHQTRQLYPTPFVFRQVNRRYVWCSEYSRECFSEPDGSPFFQWLRFAPWANREKMLTRLRPFLAMQVNGKISELNQQRRTQQEVANRIATPSQPTSMFDPLIGASDSPLQIVKTFSNHYERLQRELVAILPLYCLCQKVTEDLAAAMRATVGQATFGEPHDASADYLALQRVWLSAEVLTEITKLRGHANAYSGQLREAIRELAIRSHGGEAELFLTQKQTLLEVQSHTDLLIRNTDSLAHSLLRLDETWSTLASAQQFAISACAEVRLSQKK